MAELALKDYRVAGDYDIRIAEAGEGPVIVFIHGSGPGASGASNFRDNWPAFVAAGFEHSIANMYFIPLAMLSFYKNRGYNISNYPVTYDNYSREISLPVFYDLSDEMLKRIVDAVTNAVASTLS